MGFLASITNPVYVRGIESKRYNTMVSNRMRLTVRSGVIVFVVLTGLCFWPHRAVAWWNPITAAIHVAGSAGKTIISGGKMTVKTVALPVQTTVAAAQVMAGRKSISQAARTTGSALATFSKTAMQTMKQATATAGAGLTLRNNTINATLDPVVKRGGALAIGIKAAQSKRAFITPL